MSKAPIDMEHLNEVTDNDKAFQKELFTLFTETADNCIQTLESLCSNENNKHWREKAHELKGSSANLGANDLASICKQAMEGETLSSQDKQSLVKSIQNEYASVKEYFYKQVS